MCNELPTIWEFGNAIDSFIEGWIKTLPEWQQEIYQKGKEENVTTKG